MSATSAVVGFIVVRTDEQTNDAYKFGVNFIMYALTH
jgi:hypothetical protein